MPDIADLAGLRQRTHAHVSACVARPGRRRRLLGVAGADARRGGAADAGHGARALRATYSEMTNAGYTAVGEFHYLGVDEARAAAEAAARGGHRARAPPRRLCAGRAAADAPGILVRVPRPAGIAARRRRPGRPRPPLRPRVPSRLARGDRPLCDGRASAAAHPRLRAAARDRGVSSPSTAAARSSCSTAPGASARTSRSSTRHTPTAPSSTCSRRAGRTVCACPTTEADLADGFLPAARIDHRRIPLSIGSDSNVRIDPFEELRELEGIARRQTGRRGVFSTERLLCFGADEGARSLGLESWPEIEVDPGHDSLRGVEPGDLLDALVSSCCADVRQPRMRRCTQNAVRSR